MQIANIESRIYEIRGQKVIMDFVLDSPGPTSSGHEKVGLGLI